jgi:hypothetical protein
LFSLTFCADVLAADVMTVLRPARAAARGATTAGVVVWRARAADMVFWLMGEERG